jgi:hypothetical protein
MGRYAGWIALESGLAGGGDVVLIPEIPFHMEKVCEKISQRTRQGKRFSLVVVAEGAKAAGGELVVARQVNDASDPIRLGGIAAWVGNQVEDMIGIESRYTILGHVQRGGSPTAFDRILATRFGYHAVEAAMNRKFGFMVGLRGSDIKTSPIREAIAVPRRVKADDDLVKAAKAEPGKIKLGTFGPGTDDHVTGYMLAKQAGVQFGFVPFDSGGEILAALLGGHIGAQVTEVAEVKSQMDAGKVRILTVATEKRLEALPDVPTMSEKGWKVVVPKFRGLVVKKGTPQPVVDYLIANSLKAIQSPEFQKYQKESFVEPAFLTGKDFLQLIEAQVAETEPVLRELGF